MINYLMAIYVALLFVILTPGVLVRLPMRSSLLTSAIVHGIIFAIIYHLTNKYVWNHTYGMRTLYDATK
jgi:hypothetical protein